MVSTVGAPQACLIWQWCAFDDLGVRELYAVLALRQAVFVIEQHCLYRDLDNIDQSAFHLLGWHTSSAGRELVAYLRCVEPGIKYEEVSLGRVACAMSVRGSGVGKSLFGEGIRHAEIAFPNTRIRISAQHYLQCFYEQFGFVVTSEPYDEDGIAHVEMLR